MNVVMIVSDTFRRDHMGCYGNRWISTPVLDAFAKESSVFERAYAASFPTIPNRYDCFTGKYGFPFRGWAPLPEEETTLAERLTRAGYVTQLIVDTPHMMSGGFRFERGFRGWDWTRGQEGDRFVTGANFRVEFECDRKKMRANGALTHQHRLNTYYWKEESDRFVAQTMTKACRWLEQNHEAKKFFLWIDAFDPHEPWDPPEYFTNMYAPQNYRGQKIYHPNYDFTGYLTKGELAYSHATYCGELTLVDKWVGTVLRKIDDLGLRDTTAVFFTTDHGFYHGEHGRIGKHTIGGEPWALYEEVAHIPLIVRMPGQTRGKGVNTAVQPPDLMPTILDLCGVRKPKGMHGISFAPALRGKAIAGRRQTFTAGGFKDAKGHLNTPVTVTSGRWSLILGVRTKFLELYDIKADPGQKRNVVKKHPQVVRRLYRAFMGFLNDLNADAQKFEDYPGI